MTIMKFGKGLLLTLATTLTLVLVSVAHSFVATMGWLSADMLIGGLKKTGRDLAVDKFLATPNSPDFHYGDGRFRGVTNWPQNHFYGVPCLSATQLKDKKYHLSVPLTCNNPFTF
jgi:hypothetical protein